MKKQEWRRRKTFGIFFGFRVSKSERSIFFLVCFLFFFFFFFF